MLLALMISITWRTKAQHELSASQEVEPRSAGLAYIHITARTKQDRQTNGDRGLHHTRPLIPLKNRVLQSRRTLQTNGGAHAHVIMTGLIPKGLQFDYIRLSLIGFTRY
ncbi:unnamed protein product [Protopolystoma xenopodis]|uniref:Secreted protein n=1 Tax=Protopolystoma xenopodis TaxID=117903 RepID=A0A448WMR4_9PLAT|nr:unnamed protein product [Protopolystoma xenopodis]